MAVQGSFVGSRAWARDSASSRMTEWYGTTSLERFQILTLMSWESTAADRSVRPTLLASLCSGAGRAYVCLGSVRSALEPGLPDSRNNVMNGFRVSDRVLL
jgi:hypothetical protein